jgi:hypothetical protein
VVPDDEDPYEHPRTPAEKTSTSEESGRVNHLDAEKDVQRHVRGRNRERLGSSARAVRCSMTLQDALKRTTQSTIAGARQGSRMCPCLATTVCLEEKITRVRKLLDNIQEDVENFFRNGKQGRTCSGCQTWSDDSNCPSQNALSSDSSESEGSASGSYAFY